MSCEHTNNCSYYRTYRYKSSDRQSRLLVESYCEGNLHTLCRRLQCNADFYKEAPEDLAPNGYIVGTHKKIKAQSTRKFERHRIKNGACMLQVLGTKKALGAWIVDISEGGVRLELDVHPEELGICPDKSSFKILGYSIEDIPLPLTKEIVKKVWQNNRVMGCAFVPSPA